MTPEQRLVLIFCYIKQMTVPEMINMIVYGELYRDTDRDEDEQPNYKDIVDSYETLNAMLQGRDSAYAAALKVRNKRSSLHVNRPRVRMPRGAMPVSGEVGAHPPAPGVLSAVGGVRRQATRDYTDRSRKDLVKLALKYVLLAVAAWRQIDCDT